MISLIMLLEDLKALMPCWLILHKKCVWEKAAGGITIFVTWRED